MGESWNMKPVWEKLDNEPDPAYIRFLIYRNLGPARSLDEAYKVYQTSLEQSTGTKRNKSLQATGTWNDDCSRYAWVDRSNQWDIDMLSSMGKEVMQNLCKLFQKLTLKLISWIDDDKIAPSNITEYRQLLNDVTTLFTPSTIAAFGNLSGAGYSETTLDSEPPGLGNGN